MFNRATVFLIGSLLVAVVVYASTFTVSEKEFAIRFAVGKFDKSDFKPGLHLMFPLYHRIEKFDKRILSYDAGIQRYLTKEQKPLLVDYYIKWRIVDVEFFYRRMNGNEFTAQARFDKIVNRGLLDAFGTRALGEVISDDRDDIMKKITEDADKQLREFGIQIVDVRVKRIELPEEIQKNVYKRMRSDRTKEATEIRETGKADGVQIIAEAEKKAQIVIANAYEEAQKTRGAGDAEAARIYANAYNKNAEFFSFYRSLEAYRKSFENNDQVLVLEPSSEFFKYFKKTQPGKK